MPWAHVACLGPTSSCSPLDLSHPAPDGLFSRPSRPGARTLFLAEGLLMYLTAAEVARVLRFVHDHGGPGARLVFTVMDQGSDGSLRFRKASPAVDLWLRWRHEPFRWGLPRAQLPALLEREGFHLLEVAGAETLRGRYLEGEQWPLAEGECLAVAERFP